MKELNLINQLRFARAEFRKGFAGVSEEDGSKRLMPMNSIAWIVGHLAWHEQYYWLTRAQGIILVPRLLEVAAFGKPPGEASLKEMAELWESVLEPSNNYLENLEVSDLERKMIVKERELPFNIGTMISRVIYHYWYHNGEIQAIRQLLGHKNLPDFVSDDIETIGRFYLD
ncbi:MAG: DinB family protein [Chloroflexi bacterium]|nr:DinB family protein [Chloroflexota bacterium]